MRALDEIKVDLQEATLRHDALAVLRLAEEARSLETPEAAATAALAEGNGLSMSGSHVRALEMFEEARSLLEQLDTPSVVASCINNIGITYRFLGQYSEAAEAFDEALGIYHEVGDRMGEARAIYNLGTVYLRSGSHALALEQYERALRLYEDADQTKQIADACNSIGNVYYLAGRYPQALKYYEQARSQYEATNAAATVASVLGNLGNVYSATGDDERARTCFAQSRSIYVRLGYMPGVVASLNSLGTLHYNAEEYDRALQLFDEALAICASGEVAEGRSHLVEKRIGTLVQLHRLDEADQMLKEQAVSDNADPVVRMARAKNTANLAELKNDLEGAHTAYLQALSIAEEAGLLDQVMHNHMALRNLAQKRKDFDGYVHHNTEYQRMREDVHGREASQQMAVIEAERKMEVERREHEKERALLYGALPASVATRLLSGATVEDHFEHASVLFADVVGFTTRTGSMHPTEVVALLERLYGAFDEICAEHDVTKVKTIGDSYLCFAQEGNGESGMGNGAAERIAAVALAMQNTEFFWPTSHELRATSSNSNRIQLRIGIHSGPVSAGVIGTQRLQYDIWGDTVNVASRMESTGEAGRIQVSESFARALCLVPSASDESNQAPGTRHPALTERGEVNVKGKGSMTTYWLEGA